ncbi:MAG TPA: VWA domain-containing protein [Trueperaceae bacterium]
MTQALGSAFLWPWALALLLLLPLLAWLYRRGRKRPARAVVLFPELPAQTSLQGLRWSRHLPAILYLGACLLAFLAVARPTFAVPEPHPLAGIMLALDISRSMQATDIQPSRFDAARAALKAFVQDLPASTRVGLVTFSSYATTVVPLTTDHQRLLDAVDLLHLGFGTAIGEGLLQSLTALPSLEEREKLADDPSKLAAIVLLSDGQNRTGIDPMEAVQEVKEQQVTIHTVGVGSPGGGPIPGFGGRFSAAARFDGATLRALSEQTGGRFVLVDSAQELHDVYRALSRSLAWRTKRDEVTAAVSLAAAALLLASLGLSGWRRKVV